MTVIIKVGKRVREDQGGKTATIWWAGRVCGIFFSHVLPGADITNQSQHSFPRKLEKLSILLSPWFAILGSQLTLPTFQKKVRAREFSSRVSSRIQISWHRSPSSSQRPSREAVKNRTPPPPFCPPFPTPALDPHTKISFTGAVVGFDALP